MITVRWMCACLDREHAFEVRERRADEEVTAWVEMVRRHLGEAHALTSPFCQAPSVEYLKIPFQDGNAVGTAPPTKH